jgi:hypothetical protein
VSIFAEASLLYIRSSVDVGSTITINGYGAQLRAGAYYFVTKGIGLGGGLGYTIGKGKYEGTETDAGTTITVDLGISLRL